MVHGQGALQGTEIYLIEPFKIEPFKYVADGDYCWGYEECREYSYDPQTEKAIDPDLRVLQRRLLHVPGEGDVREAEVSRGGQPAESR